MGRLRFKSGNPSSPGMRLKLLTKIVVFKKAQNTQINDNRRYQYSFGFSGIRIKVFVDVISADIVYGNGGYHEKDIYRFAPTVEYKAGY